MIVSQSIAISIYMTGEDFKNTNNITAVSMTIKTSRQLDCSSTVLYSTC